MTRCPAPRGHRGDERAAPIVLGKQLARVDEHVAVVTGPSRALGTVHDGVALAGFRIHCVEDAVAAAGRVALALRRRILVRRVGTEAPDTLLAPALLLTRRCGRAIPGPA